VSHYCLFTGGRDTLGPDVEDAVRDVLTFLHHFYGGGLRVMHGDAPGLDTIVGTCATDLGITVKAYPYDRGRGRAGPIIRNEYMCSLLVKWENLGHSVEVIAYPGGKGTAHCSRFAEQLGLNVTHIPVPGYGVETSSTFDG
jgi:hypothetical protein